ncbi:MAG: hypothetical protein MN733_19175 [Nitrososphaera sp.]|nr:hypothetical protein [Nitrososphaera sp.]
MGYQTETAKAKNSENMKALIDFMQQHDPTGNTIRYVQVRDLVLLGKGHSKSDVGMINPEDQYYGTISLTITKKELTAQIEGKLKKGGTETRQKSGRVELENAISDALKKTATKLKRVFKWVE